MPGQIFTDGNFQAVGNDGRVVPYGKLYVNDHATGLSVTTYQDAKLTIPNTSPVILSASGKAKIFLSYGVLDIALHDQFDATIWNNNEFVVSIMDTQAAIDASYETAFSAAAAQASAIDAASRASTAVQSSRQSQESANIATNAAIVASAYANMDWAGFAVSDGELIVSYADGATSLPSLVDGEFIISY